MTNKILDFRYNAPFNDLQIINSPVALKGPTLVTFSLSGIIETDYKVDEVIINWGDNTPSEVYKRPVIFNYRKQSIYDEVLYGKVKGTILKSYSHVYNNQYNTYGAEYTSEIILHKSNGQYLYIKQPICSYWSSFYDNIERLTILNTQITPSTDNNTFVNLEGVKDNYVYVSTLKDTGSEPLSSTNTTPITSVETLNRGTIVGGQTLSLWATSDGYNIEITTPSASYLVETAPGVIFF